MPEINQSKLCWLLLHSTFCCFITGTGVLFQEKADKFTATDGEFMAFALAGMKENKIEEMSRQGSYKWKVLSLLETEAHFDPHLRGVMSITI